MTPCVQSRFKPRADGYTKTRVDGVDVYAHRLAYERARGPIPTGLTIDHLCLNKACVNPEHMEVVTLAENTRRAHVRDRACRSGHLRTPANTIHRPDGRRECRPCHNAVERRRQERTRAA